MTVAGFARFSPQNFSKLTPKLVFYLLFLSLGTIMFGYDTGMFGGLQAIPAFVDQFGDNTTINGTKALSAKLASLMTSMAFLGKFLGTFTIGPIIERYGHRWGMFGFCIMSFIGTILEATAKVPAQFIIGRVCLYYAVGFTENCVPTYQTELAPAAARGAFVGSIQFFIAAGGFVSAGLNKHFSTSTAKSAWLIPVCIQVILPFIVMCGLPFIPDSPRWLLSKGRREDAIRVLRSVRPQEDVDAGLCEEEVAAIEEALKRDMEKRPWMDLFKGTNLRRTTIAGVVFFMAQLTGQAFLSQYGPRFYTTVGLGAQAFTYQLINSACGLFICFVSLFLLDIFGRRPILLFGGVTQAIFLYLTAGIGGKYQGTINIPAGKAIVACTVLFQCCFNASWAPIPYVLASEIGTGPLREKTMAFTSTLNVVSAFLVSFTLPYLLNAPYAALGAKIGWIYGSFCILMVVYTYFFVPETKGRSLEELDELFDTRVSAIHFGEAVTSGAGSRVADLEKLPASALDQSAKPEGLFAGEVLVDEKEKAGRA